MQKRHMGIMRYILPLVAAMVMVSCVGDDRTVNIDDPFIDNGGLKGIYLGVWSIEGQPDIPSELTVYDTGFSFKTLPVEAVLRAVLPGHDIGRAAGVGYMVPYDETGYSAQAMYYSVHPEQWVTGADIDGKPRTVVMHFVSREDDYAFKSVATYSMLSGVYKIVLHMRGIEIYDGQDDERPQTVDRDLKLTFVTLRKI